MKPIFSIRFWLPVLSLAFVGAMTPALALPPSTSEYVTDGQSIYNNDDTTDTFQLIKIVACFIKNTKPELKAGQGKYVAWIGQSTCEDYNSSSSDTEKRFNKVTVEAGTDSRGHVIVRFWLQALNDRTDNGVTTYYYEPIFVSVDITQGVALAPPYGYWTINYCKPTGSSLTATTCDEKGFAQVSPTTLKVYNKGLWDDGTTVSTRQGTINFDPLTNGEILTGRGSILVNETNPTNNNNNREAFSRFAFKPGYYRSKLFGTVNKDICYDRSAENGYENVWQTWLYNNDANATSGTGAYGQRFNMNGGMSIKKSPTDNENRGWASYWGIWFPEGVTKPTSGSTVYADVSGQTNKAYTYRKTTGNLQKNVITSGALSGIQGIPLTLTMPKNVAVAGSSSTTTSSTRVAWNGTAFVVSDFGGDATLGGKVLTFSEIINGYAIGQGWDNTYRSGSINMNQEGTNNWYQVVLGDGSGTVTTDSSLTPGCTWANNRVDCYLLVRSANNAKFTQRMQTRVLPGTSDATAVQALGDLVCTGSCIDNLGAQVQQGQVSISSALVYNYDATSGIMSVVRQGASDTSVAGTVQKPTTGWYHETEALVSSNNTSSLNSAKCQWDATAYCGWQLRENVSSGTFTYYTYSVSPDQWNDTEFLVDSSGSIVTFDVPLNLTYTVTQSKSPANGQTLNLQYQGNAQLNMPGHCIVRSTGVTVDCNTGSWSDKFYVNDFSVPPWKGTLNDYATDGTLTAKTPQATLIKLDNSSKSYLAKWMSKGVMFRTVTGGQCNDLTVPSQDSLVLPGLPDWTNPADPASSNYIGSWQEPSATPVIIDGVFVTQ